MVCSTCQTDGKARLAWFTVPDVSSFGPISIPKAKRSLLFAVAHWISAFLLLAVPPMAAWGQEPQAWGEAVQGIELKVEVADGPLPLRAGEVLPLQVQLRNRGTRPVSFVAEAIVHPDIEIDGVWYVQARKRIVLFLYHIEARHITHKHAARVSAHRAAGQGCCESL